MKRKIVAIMLSMTMVTAALVGCGSNPVSETANSVKESSEVSNSEGTVVAEEPAEPVKITWISSYSNEVGDTPDTWAEALLEEEYNLDITVVEGVLRANFGAYVASGDIFDATVFTHYMASTSNFKEMIEQGVVRDIPEEWLWEYYPTGMELLTEIVGEEYWEQGLNTFGEGTVGVLSALTSQYGDGIVYNNNSAPSVNSNYSIHFTSEATDEQVIAVLKMLEGLVNNDELATKILYGEEGVDYTMENGVLSVMEHVSDEYKSKKGIGRALDVFQHNTAITELAMTEADKMYSEMANTQQTVYI